MTVKYMNRQITGKQRGFTLLEVMIALLVLSIGLLGLAALQTVGLRSNQMANMRTLATQATYDMTDRMRANQFGMGITTDNITQDLIYSAGSDFYLIATGTDAAATPPDCDAIACDEQQLATYDLTHWRDEVARLPGGLSSITQTTAGGVTTHTITVHWNESRDPAVTGGLTSPPASRTDLRCFRLTM